MSSLASTTASSSTPTAAPQPWWRFGMVWMVIAGPAGVVVAGIVTVTLAFLNIDPEVYDRQAAPPATLGAAAVKTTPPAPLKAVR